MDKKVETLCSFCQRKKTKVVAGGIDGKAIICFDCIKLAKEKLNEEKK